MDLSQIPTEELMKMRAGASGGGGVDLSNVSTEDLMRMKAAASNPSLLAQIGRQVGLTARAGIQGITALPALIADIPGNIAGTVEQAKKVIQGAPLSTFLRPVDVPYYPIPNQILTINDVLNKSPLPKPETATERVAQDVASAMAAGGGMAGAANIVKGASDVAPTVGRIVAEKLASNPGMQIVSAGTGAAGGGITREAGGGPGAQLAATLIAGAAPSIAQAAGAATVRGLMRGGEAGRQKVAQNIETFENAGTTPTVGQATEARAPRLVETMLTKTPGSAGTMAAKAQAQHEQIGQRVSDLADELTTRSGAAPAGRQIKEGITGGFMPAFRAKQQQLYDDLDRYIPQDTMIPASNIVAKAAQISKPIAGAPETSALIQTPGISKIGTSVASDAAAKEAQPIFSRILGADGKPILTGETAGQPAGIPYSAIKELRTAIGEKLNNPSLTDDIGTAKWKQLYGALSDDMRAAAKQAGPDAEKAFTRANDYTRAGHARIENVLEPIINRDLPEKVYLAATSGMKEGASTIWPMVRSLPKDGQNVIASTVLKRLGTALPGGQDNVGEVFSPETFLTNWNKISPEAKTALFSRYGPDFTKNLDSIAEVASNMRTGTKVFTNPSGTEGAFTARMGIAGVLLSVLWGHPGIAASLAGGMATAGAGAKLLMTNPDFVRWLARSTTLSPGALPGSIAALEATAKNQPPDVQQAMLDYANAVKSVGSGQSASRQSTGARQ